MCKGLDVGTCFLVSATKDIKNPESEIQIKSVRDAFLELDQVDPGVLNMLKMSNISYITEGDSIYVIGEPALNLANLLRKEARRPLSKGIIAAGELEAEKMLMILLKSILGTPSVEDEVVYYSIPGNPIDSDNSSIIYHREIFKKMISSFGFSAYPMNEAAAIVYANGAKDGFTALSSSFGAGMVNTALLYKTMVGMSFSTMKAGDWLDSSSAMAVGKTATQLMSIKEKGVNLLDPSEGEPRYLREREAIIVFYKNLINFVIDSIKKEFKKNSSTVELPDSIPWIISGGTTKAKNFLEFFKQEFDKVRKDFPINISEVRLAGDPLSDVAKGLLIAAMNE
jgi:actin-like ATPase involved in cell morphogenesis